MKNLLIGSRALVYWKQDSNLVKPETDWDVISDNPILGTEWHDPKLLNNSKFERFTSEDQILDFNGWKLYVVNPIGLCIIKRSHLWRDLSFNKHITHYHKHLRAYRNFLLIEDQDLLKERTEMSHKMFPQQGPNLNQSVENFFDDAVTKKYNHDWLHELYAYEDKPMYTKMQRDNSKAWCEKDMWDKFSYDQKLQTVAEETYVIATERFLVPSNFSKPAKLCYNKALDKVCTTLCKGWFRDFAIDNYPEVLQMFNQYKVNEVKTVLESTIT